MTLDLRCGGRRSMLFLPPVLLRLCAQAQLRSILLIRRRPRRVLRKNEKMTLRSTLQSLNRKRQTRDNNSGKSDIREILVFFISSGRSLTFGNPFEPPRTSLLDRSRPPPLRCSATSICRRVFWTTSDGFSKLAREAALSNAALPSSYCRIPRARTAEPELQS